jgi:hypothetical protein
MGHGHGEAGLLVDAVPVGIGDEAQRMRWVLSIGNPGRRTMAKSVKRA